MSEVVPIRVADAPAKNSIIEMLDRLRAEAESGELLCLVAIPVFRDSEFSVRVEGEIAALQLSGLLLRACLDASGLTCR